MLLGSQLYPEGAGWALPPGGKYGHYGLNAPMMLDNVTLLGLDRDQLNTLAILDPGRWR